MPRRLVSRCVSDSRLRSAWIILLDAVATLCALNSAFFLRFNARTPPEYVRVIALGAPLLVVIRLLALMGLKLHRWSFMLSGISEAVRLGVAMVGGSAAFILAFDLVSPQRFPRAVYVLEFFIASTLIAGFRYAPRVAKSWYTEQHRKRTALRTVIVGAGQMGDLLARDLLRSPDSKHYVVGYVDDSPTKLHMHLNGKPVLGKIADLPRLIVEEEIEMVLLAIGGLAAERIREILAMCSRCKAKFKIMPSASFSYVDQRISAALLHDLSPEDLLPRESVAFDYGEIQHLVGGRRVIVTGAAGSIGGEICRQLAMHGVGRLVMVDMNENELYLGVRRLRDEYPAIPMHTEIADIRDAARLRQLGDRYRPEYVFHAAAHKHVPLMEDAPGEAVKNNVFGTLNVARMADHCGAEHLVVISTDKAVKPSSVMGATKRIAELAVRELARNSRTKMTAVRFGNVLGSAGSVVPIFKEQIERGGPVTVTHPDCTRYFMTIPEAVGLVLIAGLGGYGELCVLDMGEPIRIADLAANLITMAGYIPGEEIAIKYMGLRPGEKLFEELLTEEEEQTHQVRNRIMVANSPAPPVDLQQRLADLAHLADAGDRDGILRAIKGIVPSFRQPAGEQSAAPAEPQVVDVAAAQVVPFRKAASLRN